MIKPVNVRGQRTSELRGWGRRQTGALVGYLQHGRWNSQSRRAFLRQ
jgi:hypothetical protein